MTNPVTVLRQLRDIDGNTGNVLYFWCPGCKSAHSVHVSGKLSPMWEWDGNMDSPTISPSILCYNSAHLCETEHYAVNECTDWHNCGIGVHTITYDDPTTSTGKHYWHGREHSANPAWGNCHSFIKNGVWQFLPDCAHALAGQDVPMVPLPDWMVRSASR